jgi:hypothetical protein
MIVSLVQYWERALPDPQGEPIGALHSFRNEERGGGSGQGNGALSKIRDKGDAFATCTLSFFPGQSLNDRWRDLMPRPAIFALAQGVARHRFLDAEFTHV